jgi:hypothetical protein
MLDRLTSLVFAACLAFLAWLYARSRDPEVLDNVPIPVQVSLAPGQSEYHDLEVTGPAQIPVCFRGPPSRIRELRDLLQQGALQVAVTLTVPDDRKNENKYLDTVRVDASDIHPPPGVTALVLEGRNRIPVTLRRIVQRRLPVRLDPPADDRVGHVFIEPESVLVRGPKVILDRVRAVPTQPCLLATGTEGGPDQDLMNLGAVPLVRDLDGRPITCVPEAVAVRVVLRPKEKTCQLDNVPIHFLCPTTLRLRAQFLEGGGGKIAVQLAGPADREPNGVAAFVDLTRHEFKAGIYVNEPLTFQLPDGFHLLGDTPSSTPFQLLPIRRDDNRPLEPFRGW